MNQEHTFDAELIDPGVHCRRCAAVCCRLPVLLLPDDRPPQRYIGQDEYGLAVMAKGDDGWCLALDRDSLACSIYEDRPQVCRDFAMGGGDCRDQRAQWARLGDPDAPG